MARPERTKTHLENLAITPKTAHGDAAGDAVLNIYPVDVDPLSPGTAALAIKDIGTIDPTVTNTAAGGDRAIQTYITQSTATALTGTLDGVYARATAGDTGGAGTVRGAEIGARLDDSVTSAAAAVVTGGYFWADAKAKTATTLRGLEVSLDGGAGGTSTLAAGIEIFNNSSATQTSSYAVDINEGSPSGRKAFTADMRLQNGETISNATNNEVAVSGQTKANVMFATFVSNTDGSETIAAGDSGKIYIGTKTDGATTFTLPTPAAGLAGHVNLFYQTADQNMVITGDADKMTVFGGDGTSQSITFDQATKIGTSAIAFCTGTMWLVTPKGAATIA